MTYVIDSYAWLEYFMGTDAGRKAAEIIDSPVYEKSTPSICLAEIYAKVLKTEGSDSAEIRKEFIKSKTALNVLIEEVAINAAKINVQMKLKVSGWGLADSIVLATARNRGGKVVTGDSHFKGLAETYFIK